jgi:glycosyltransferase involved in cell wall biosynthesis
MRFLLGAAGSAHLLHISRALQAKDALAAVWVSDKNQGVKPEFYRRCWLYHLMMKPFYHRGSYSLRDRMAHELLPVWAAWIRRQKAPPFDVAYGIPGHATPLFDVADRCGAFKLIDATNSHPTSYYGFWQRECDIWAPGSKPGTPRKYFMRINRELERADLILCPSKFVFESMLYNGIPETKCVINPYGVDTSTFTPRIAPPKKPQFICVGQIGLRKGHQYLFAAFDKVRRVLPEAELAVVGVVYPDIRREFQRWQHNIRHYQDIPLADLTELLRNSTAFVFPSNEEGFAKAVLEAMASGLPIIATHQSGVTTLIKDGVEGFIVRGRDVDELANRMIQVATDISLNQKMGQAAALRGAEKNSWDDYVERVIQICRQAIQSRSLHN